jgi:hypothetical protein
VFPASPGVCSTISISIYKYNFNTRKKITFLDNPRKKEHKISLKTNNKSKILDPKLKKTKQNQRIVTSWLWNHH